MRLIELPASPDVPGWLAAEMPPGYQTRLTEVQRLSQELRAMEQLGRLLWQHGPELTEAVDEAFAAMGVEAELASGSDGTFIRASIDEHRGLLLRATSVGTVVQKKDQDLSHVFRLLQETSGAGDRVVLVANGDPELRPADRPEPLAPDALALLQRLGINVISGATIFALWTMSLRERNSARGHLERLHAQEGGVFLLPAAAMA
jgi:hypothetical protein